MLALIPAPDACVYVIGTARSVGTVAPETYRSDPALKPRYVVLLYCSGRIPVVTPAFEVITETDVLVAMRCHQKWNDHGAAKSASPAISIDAVEPPLGNTSVVLRIGCPSPNRYPDVGLTVSG